MKFLPQRNRRLTMDSSGHDPLGLSRVSDALTHFLLTSNRVTSAGINAAGYQLRGRANSGLDAP